MGEYQGSYLEGEQVFPKKIMSIMNGTVHTWKIIIAEQQLCDTYDQLCPRAVMPHWLGFSMGEGKLGGPKGKRYARWRTNIASSA